jgi:hypothetical protein
MNRTQFLTLVASSVALVGAGCGGGTKKVVKPVTVVAAPARKKPPKPKPKPKPVCVRQSEQAVIGMSSADGDLVQYCVGDGSGEPQCYSVELDQKKWAKLPSPPIPQARSMTPPVARLQSTPSEVRVCPLDSDSCKVLKPRIRAGENPLEAAVNAQGTVAAILIGDAEAGKGQVQVWNVAKKKKTAAIKYAKGDFKCGTVHVVDELVFISAGVCAGPSARGALYSTKGKKLADVGGKDFGTYGTVPVQLGDHRWAFLSESGGVIAIHDSTNGKLEKTIDLLGLWTGGDDDGAAGGNPGESALLRGADGKLLVVTGSPRAGSIGVVDVEAGTVDVVPALACTGDEPAGDDAAGGDDDGDDDDGAGDRDGDGDGDDDADGGGGARKKKPSASAADASDPDGGDEADAPAGDLD